MGAESLRNAHNGAGLPAPVTLGWEARDVFSPGAVAHGPLVRLARDPVSPGRGVAQWGIMFDASGALQGVRDVAAALENLPGLHPAMGPVSLFQGDECLPTILQQWAAHMAIYQVSGGHTIQVYSCGEGITHPPGAEGSVTWVPRSTYSGGYVVFKAASSSSTSCMAANIDARSVGRYLRPRYWSCPPRPGRPSSAVWRPRRAHRAGGRPTQHTPRYPTPLGGGGGISGQ